jgi:hypothetical protein
LLYDTLAARLYADIDQERVYHRFVADIGRQAEKRVRRALRRRLAGGLQPQDYLAIEKTAVTANRLVYRLTRFLDSPGLKLPYLVEKWVYAASMSIRLVLQLAAVAAIAVGVSAATRAFEGRSFDVAGTAATVGGSRWFAAVAVALGILAVRKILFRLNDKVEPGR